MFMNTAIDQNIAKFKTDNGRDPTPTETEKIREWENCCGMRSKVHDPFHAFATEKLELVEIDFPNGKKQPDALKKANDALKSKHGADGFPTILVFNSEGKEVWRQVGYMAGGPEAWIGKLKSLK